MSIIISLIVHGINLCPVVVKVSFVHITLGLLFANLLPHLSDGCHLPPLFLV